MLCAYTKFIPYTGLFLLGAESGASHASYEISPFTTTSEEN